MTARGTIVGPAQCDDLEAAVDVLLQRILDAAAPRRRVMWVVRCPSGQLVRGDITINSARTDRSDAVRDHVTEIRGILTTHDRAFNDAPAHQEEGDRT